jgi:hypothetical protein
MNRIDHKKKKKKKRKKERRRMLVAPYLIWKFQFFIFGSNIFMVASIPHIRDRIPALMNIERLWVIRRVEKVTIHIYIYTPSFLN